MTPMYLASRSAYLEASHAYDQYGDAFEARHPDIKAFHDRWWQLAKKQMDAHTTAQNFLNTLTWSEKEQVIKADLAWWSKNGKRTEKR